MNSKKTLFGTILAVAATVPLLAAVPVVSDVSMTQDASRRVTITYTLSDAPAVVTVDIQTNANGSTWSSIGGENIQQMTGDVWKKVETGSRTIKWRPDLSWPDHKIEAGGARAVVTAWATNNTPDYMAVDITSTGGADKETYYPSAAFVPGGVSNSLYKTGTLLMRKIMAKGVTWTMGSVAESSRTAAREATHLVTLSNNYYIGVYPVTQTQWQQITGYNPSKFKTEGYMRPVENIAYTDCRLGKGTESATASASGGVYPNPPYGQSFLGLLRDKTKLDFDLPSEAQWEYAARAGNGEGYWGDGSAMSINSSTGIDENLNRLARYLNNPSSNSAQAANVSATIAPAEGGTAIVGSYAPNAWGLYDVYGNVWEWCLDGFAANISDLNGAVAPFTDDNRVNRGGFCTAPVYQCRPAQRGRADMYTRGTGTVGVRLCISIANNEGGEL